MLHIILSPHFDDAVLSLGGSISKLTSDGERVHVITIFTRKVDPSLYPERFRLFAMQDERKKEDETALTKLGATFEWFDFPERIFRKPAVKNYQSLFKTPPRLADFSELESIKKSIREVLEHHPNSRLYVPLGVGNHYDHVEVFLASMLAMIDHQAFDRFAFYEDFYALRSRLRKEHFVSKQVVWKWRDSPESASIRWWFGVDVLASFTPEQSPDEYIHEEIKDFKWVVKPIRINNQQQAAKIKALACYQSQLKALGGLRILKRVYQKYHRFWGDAEPLWYLST